MTNKTAIDALTACAELEKFVIAIEQYEEYTSGQPNHGTCRGLDKIKKASRMAREALATLDTEKPAEDARLLAIDISLGALDRAEFWEVIVPKRIKSYAEAYHARKIKE